MAIFQRLAGGPIAVTELAQELPVSRPAVSQHLRVLKDAGLVTDSKAGTRRLYQLDPEGVARLRAHFDAMWTTAMSSFQMAAENRHMERSMGSIEEKSTVRKSIRVRAGIERAFEVFAEQMETWWPATHHIGSTPFAAIFVEPRAGGRWYERDVEGKLTDWGKVLAWDPPHRVAFSWHVGPGHDQPGWVCDPDPAKASEVEIRFTAEGPDATLVELVHSKLDRHGEGYEQLRAIFDGPGAWITILELYGKAAEREKA